MSISFLRLNYGQRTQTATLQDFLHLFRILKGHLLFLPFNGFCRCSFRVRGPVNRETNSGTNRMEEKNVPRGSIRPSFERKMLPSLPLSNSNSTHRGKSLDPDFSLLDYKSVDDFLHYTRSKSEFQDLSKHLAKQLKASRSLLSMSRFLTVGTSPREIINQIVESASAVVDAERVVFLELEQDTGDLVYLKYQDNTEAFRIREGIERKNHFLFSAHFS
jgi:hypothetical protein